MSDILSSISTRQTEQTQRAKPEQVQNKAGGYVYQADDDVCLHRFLTLGTDGSTYYTSAKDLTRDNAAVVFRCVTADPLKVVAKIVEISTAGRAPKQAPALFALAICASHASDEGRIAALQAIPAVCRTASTLFTFIKYCEQFRGWGKGLQRAIYRWYNNRPIDKLTYQAVKYRARDDWRHADLLRLAHNHVAPPDAEHAVLYNWIAGRGTVELARGGGHKGLGMENLPEVKGEMETPLPALIGWFEELQATDNRDRVVSLIAGSDGAISWEMIPDRWINDPLVWEALITYGVPQTALMRQLPRITRLNLGSGTTKVIAEQLVDPEKLKQARVHPINVLVAMKTYASGHGEKGKLTWTPERRFTEALDAAFYAAFGTVERIGNHPDGTPKSILMALDLSGSMEWNNCSGLPITPREVCAALSMITAAVEPNHEILGFTQNGWTAGVGRNTRWGAPAGVSRLDISPRRRLDDIVNYTRSQPAGGTDCALPMVWATQHHVEVDTFVVYTDNETWAGVMHVDEALEQYRQRMSRDARLVVAAMTATGSSLCDPKDPMSMDISGFDSTCPQLISNFSAGRL